MTTLTSLTTFADAAKNLGTDALLFAMFGASESNADAGEQLRVLFQEASDEDLLGYARDKVLKAHEDQVQTCFSKLKELRIHAQTKRAWRHRK